MHTAVGEVPFSAQISSKLLLNDISILLKTIQIKFDKFVQVYKLNKLMKNGGVYTESIHVEVLCRNLIRDKNDPTKLPDYTKPDVDYIITSIHNSIFYSNSVITSLTFERLQSQISSPITYKKTGTSPMDRLFMLE